MRSILISAVVGFMALGGSAVAQGFDPMAMADLNQDGKVSLEEYAGFNEMGWGFFSGGRDKVKVADLPPMAKPSFEGVTPDAQGYVTKAMYTAADPIKFKVLDKNGDGFLDAAELQAGLPAAPGKG